MEEQMLIDKFQRFIFLTSYKESFREQETETDNGKQKMLHSPHLSVKSDLMLTGIALAPDAWPHTNYCNNIQEQEISEHQKIKWVRRDKFEPKWKKSRNESKQKAGEHHPGAGEQNLQQIVVPEDGDWANDDVEHATPSSSAALW